MIDIPPLLAIPLLVFFIALPAADAWRRRQRSREVSEVAADLAAYAEAVRREARCLPLDEALCTRLIRLRVRESTVLQLAHDLSAADAPLVADAAQRLATRLRRIVAFERKMLARTAPGLRRGAVAATLPPVALVVLHGSGWDIPAGAIATLLVADAAGCALLWRLAKVGV